MKKHGEKGVEKTLKEIEIVLPKVEEAIEFAKSKKTDKGYSIPVIRKVWAALCAQHEWGFLSPWTKKQAGQVRLLQAKLEPFDMIEVLELIIPSWHDFCKATNWSKTPPAPQIGFMLTQADVIGTMMLEALQSTAQPVKQEKPPMKYKFALPKIVSNTQQSSDLTNATGTGDNKTNDSTSEDE